jgi:murein DD-endopeptidase MepM/ murein hydrolase activator NlpD
MPDIQSVHKSGNLLVVRYVDGTQGVMYPSSGQYWTMGKNGSTPPPPPPPDDENPDDPPPPPPGGGGAGAWTHPLPGAVFTSPYGYRGDGINGGIHYGVDLSTGMGQVGQPVLAPTDIVITQAVYQNDDTFHMGTAGNYVKGHAVDGSYTFNFFHLSSISCSVGQTIPRGTAVGVEGATGNVTGLHLHLETYAGVQNNPGTPPYGDPLDPAPIFQAHGVTF